MLRTLASVVAGYLITGLCVMVLFSAWYLVLGTEGAYQAASYRVSAVWIAGSHVLGVIAAFIGGFATARMARNQTAPHILAVVFLVVGTVAAILWTPEGMDLVREGEIGVLEAAGKSIEPRWSQFLSPFLGSAGVLLGAYRARRPWEQPARDTDS